MPVGRKQARQALIAGKRVREYKKHQLLQVLNDSTYLHVRLQKSHLLFQIIDYFDLQLASNLLTYDSQNEKCWDENNDSVHEGPFFPEMPIVFLQELVNELPILSQYLTVFF